MKEGDNTGITFELFRLSEEMGHLDLLGSPALVGFAHVGWGLNGGNEFQYEVADTNYSNNRSGDFAKDVVMQQQTADEDVDWGCQSPL